MTEFEDNCQLHCISLMLQSILGIYAYKLCIKGCYVRVQEDVPVGKNMCPSSLITGIQLWNTCAEKDETVIPVLPQRNRTVSYPQSLLCPGNLLGQLAWSMQHRGKPQERPASIKVDGSPWTLSSDLHTCAHSYSLFSLACIIYTHKTHTQAKKTFF